MQLLSTVKTTIQTGQQEAIKQVNRALIDVYWQIGRHIVESQQKNGWGKSVVEDLSRDLKTSFPNQTGFSARNLWDMRRFHETYKDFPNLRQLVAEIPWGHHLLIMQRAKEAQERQYYLQATQQFKWSRNVLLNQIKAKAYERQLQLPQHNFKETLPEHIAEQAEETIKNTYSLEFLGIDEVMLERDLEKRFLQQLQAFLLELGYGFTFIGSQYVVTLKEKQYRIDLLFFHRKLNCLIAIDLKISSFKPEYAGKMNFYLELLDEQVRLPRENPSIGIILCAEKDVLEVEYTLRNSNKPMGVSEYQLISQLPEDLKDSLPSPESIKERLKNGNHPSS